MRSGIKAFAFALTSYTLCCGISASVSDAAQETGVNVVATPGAPVAITHCTARTESGELFVSSNAINRSDVFLTSYVVRWFLYDHSEILMGQSDSSNSFSTDLAPNDTTSSGNNAIYYFTEPLSSLSRVKCRLESAKFEGGLTWTYGRVWHRRLGPLPRVESFSDNAPVNSERKVASGASQSGDLSNVHLEVANAWNDTVNGNLLVHVAVNVRASSTAAVIDPANLQLSMKMADGKDRVFTAMNNAAPTYQKLDPLGQSSTTQTAFEVDPKEDLGRLGRVDLFANSTARIVATFAIGDVSVADPKDNKRVVLK